MKRWIVFLCLVSLSLLSACALQPSSAGSNAGGNTVNDNCGGSITVYGGAASVARPLVGSGYCTAVVSYKDKDTFGRPLVVNGVSRAAHYAILYIDRPDTNWHYDARLVFVGPAEEQASSLAALNPGKNWTPEFAFAFVPNDSATPALTSELAAAIVKRIAPVDEVFAFGDVSVSGARTCAILSDVLSPK